MDCARQRSRVGRYIVDLFAAEINLAPVSQAFEVFLAGLKHILFSPVPALSPTIAHGVILLSSRVR